MKRLNMLLSVSLLGLCALIMPMDGMRKGTSGQQLQRTASVRLKGTGSLPCIVKCQKEQPTPTDILIASIVDHPQWNASIKIHVLELAAIDELMKQKPGLPNPNLPKYQQALKTFSKDIPRIVKAREEDDVYRLTNPLLRLPDNMDDRLKSILSPILSNIDSTRIANFDHRIARDSAQITAISMKTDKLVISRQDSQPRLNNLIKQQHESISKKMEIVPDIQQSAKDINLLKKYTTMTTDSALVKTLEDSILSFEEQTKPKEEPIITRTPETINPAMQLAIVVTALQTNEPILSPRPIQTPEQNNQQIPSSPRQELIEIQTPQVILEQPRIILEQPEELEKKMDEQPTPNNSSEDQPLIETPLPEKKEPETSPAMPDQAFEEDITDNQPEQPSEIIPAPTKVESTPVITEEEPEPIKVPDAQPDNVPPTEPVTNNEELEQPSPEQKPIPISQPVEESSKVVKMSLLSWMLSGASNMFWWFVSLFISL